MSGDNIIRFGRAKKALGKTRAAQNAQENRVRFGRAKAEKLRDKIAKAKAETHIAGHKLPGHERQTDEP